ncbi:melatonin receptor type 1A, partial [Mytilus galloprovincialis]
KVKVPEYEEEMLNKKFMSLTVPLAFKIYEAFIIISVSGILTCYDPTIPFNKRILINIQYLTNIIVKMRYPSINENKFTLNTIAKRTPHFGKVEGRPFFMQYPLLCDIIGKVCTVSCIVSLGSITLLSFNRYILICHNSHYEKIFTRRSCIIMCISLYLVGMIMVLLNSAGIGGHGFDDKSLECIWDRMATYSYTVVFSVCLVWIPLIVLGISYLKLFLYVRHKRKQVTSTENAVHVDNKSLRLAKTIFIVYAVFSICWIPFAMLLVADAKDTFSHEVHLSITVFAHLHPSINWLIYYVTNGNFKTGCLKIFKIRGQEFSSQPIGTVPKSVPVMSIHMKSLSSEDLN